MHYFPGRLRLWSAEKKNNPKRTLKTKVFKEHFGFVTLHGQVLEQGKVKGVVRGVEIGVSMESSWLKVSLPMAED